MAWNMPWGSAWPRAALALGLIAPALSGCVDQMPDASVGRGDIRNAIAKGEMTSPRAATVALVSLDGAPPDVEAAFRSALGSAAATREITLTDVASARHLLRAYLSAYPAEGGGTDLSYTFDLFDAGTKRREARVADTLTVPDGTASPWAALTPAAAASLAGHGADALAVSLAGMPEAQASGAKMAAAPAVPAASGVN